MAPALLWQVSTSASAPVVISYYAPQLLPREGLSILLTGLVLFVIQFVAYQLYTIIIYPNFLSPLRHLPSPPGTLLGDSTRDIVREPSGMPMRRWAENVPNDGLLRYSVWFAERVLLTNAKAIGEVLVTKNYDFQKPWHVREGLGRILGVGILLAEGDEHKRQRKSLMPAFAFRHIRNLIPVFWSKSGELTRCLARDSKTGGDQDEKPSTATNTDSTEKSKHAPGVIDVDEYVSRATLDIIGLSGMGKDFGSLENPDNELSVTYRKIFNASRVAQIMGILSIFLPLWFLRALPIERNDTINQASRLIKQTCRDLIANKRKVMEEKERTDIDIVSVALESGGFSDEDLVNQMMTFLAAGHETTASSMNWAIYLMCKHPDVQSKLRAEVRSKLNSPDEPITAAQLDSCQYLHAVCTEILRLWGPVGLTLRIAAVDTTINGQYIPKGTTVIIAPAAVNVNTHLWGPDGHEFKPERWLDADGKANKQGGADSNYSFLTFLHGPRSCIGQKFAQAEFECLLAAWVGRFETEFEEGSPYRDTDHVDIKGGVTMKPKGGLWVQLKELDGW